MLVCGSGAYRLGIVVGGLFRLAGDDSRHALEEELAGGGHRPPRLQAPFSHSERDVAAARLQPCGLCLEVLPEGGAELSDRELDDGRRGVGGRLFLVDEDHPFQVHPVEQEDEIEDTAVVALLASAREWQGREPAGHCRFADRIERAFGHQQDPPEPPVATTEPLEGRQSPRRQTGQTRKARPG